MSSSEFRNAYHALREPVVVTASGRPIGIYTPGEWELVQTDDPFPNTLEHRRMTQAEKDAILRKANRSRS